MVTAQVKMAFRQILGIFAIVMSLMFSTGCGSGSSSNKENSIPLTSPKEVSVSGKNGGLQLYWTTLAPVQDVNATYEVWYGAEESFAKATKVEDNATVAGGMTSLYIDGLENGTTYYVYVKAIYAGIGEADVSSAFTGMPVGVPATPVITGSNGWDGVLEIIWDESLYASSYKIFWKEDATGTTPPSDAQVKAVSAKRVLISGVTDGANYGVWLQATNTAGDSGYTYVSVSSTSASAIPDAPQAGSVVPGGSGQLLLTFPAVAQASGYTVKYATINTPEGAQVIDIAAQSGTITTAVPGLTNGTLYYVWVAAKNSLGVSSFTAMGSATPASRTATAAIDYNNLLFNLGTADSEYIWAENVPASVFFPSGRFSDRLSRFRETAIGDLYCDGAAWYLRDRYPEDPVDFVFINGGFIEGPIVQGKIVLGDIFAISYGADSHEDTLVTLTLTGSDLMKVFQTSAQTNHTGRGSRNTGGWGIVSSEVRYTIQYLTVDPEVTSLSSEETSSYQKGWIKEDSLTVNGVAIDPNGTYRVATTSYLANGNEGYLAFLKGTERKDYSEYFWQVVAHYIYEMGTITPYTDGRIHLIGGVPLNPPGWEAGPLDWVPPYDNTLEAIYPGSYIN